MDFDDKQKIGIIIAFILVIVFILLFFNQQPGTAITTDGNTGVVVGGVNLTGGPSAGLGTSTPAVTFGCSDVNACIFGNIWSSLDANLEYYYLKTVTSSLTLPSIVPNNGKFLSTDGTNLLWSVIDTNLLGTDISSWAMLDANLSATYAPLTHFHDLIYLRINDFNDYWDDRFASEYTPISLSGYVPYNGADKNVDLGNNYFNAKNIYYDALKNNYLGDSETPNLTTGHDNFYVNGAGAKTTTGYDNIGIGDADTLTEMTTANRNIAIGGGALGGLTTNAYTQNIGVGTNAGRYYATSTKTRPTRSMYLGHYTQASGSVPSNENVFGYSAIGKGSNTFVFGQETSSTTKYYLFGDWINLKDNKYIKLGAGEDFWMGYDGTNAIINPKAVGSGILDIQGRTQVDGLNIQGTVLDGSSSTAVQIHQQNENYWTALFYNDNYSTGTPIYGYFGWDSGKFSQGTEVNKDLAFYTNGFSNERLIIKNDGNIEMSHSLDVAKNISANNGYFDGNSFISVPYGSMFIKDDAGRTTTISVQDVYYQVKDFNEGLLNGFVFADSNLIPSYSGVYKIDFDSSVSDGASGEHGWQIFVNDVGKDNCYAHLHDSGSAQNISFSCLLKLNAGDMVNVKVDDHALPASNISTYSGSLNIIRVGN